MAVGDGDMDEKPTFGDFIMGVEGLAILRSWLEDPLRVKERAQEIVEIVAQREEEPWSEAIVGVERSVTAGYGESASTYDDDESPLIRAEESVVRELIANYPAGKALDAACGTGRHAEYMVLLGHQVTGIDATTEMLTVAKSKVPSAQFETGSLESLPLPDNSMDLVVCSLGLAHCADLGPPIRELGRVVRSGRPVILSDLHPFTVMLGGHAYYPISRTETGFVRNYVHLPSEYLAAFRESGLNVVQCIERLCGDEEIDAMGFDEQMEDLMIAAFKGVPIAMIWELVKG